MEPRVPLSFPNNGDDAKLHAESSPNPNCTTAILIDGDYPSIAFSMDNAFCRKLSASFGQRRARDAELGASPRCFENRPARRRKSIRILSPSMSSEVDAFLEMLTKEEMKMQTEGRRYQASPQFWPLYLRACSLFTARIQWRSARIFRADFGRTGAGDFGRKGHPGLELIDEPARHRYPMPLQVRNRDKL